MFPIKNGGHSFAAGKGDAIRHWKEVFLATS
jgi:hypothetical protein